MSEKRYSEPKAYEAKLKKVMSRLGVDSYNYDWSRFECWVEFVYKGQHYRFSHSVENAKNHGVNIKYGSDVFAQVVLSLEDLARMVERGIYDLSTWVSGMKYLPEVRKIDPCFIYLGFEEMPKTKDELKSQYRILAKAMHPDAGGNESSFLLLTKNYEKCLEIIEKNKIG